MNVFSDAVKEISKALFTNRCEICGEVIEIDDKLCSECSKLAFIHEPLCELCGVEKTLCKCKKHKNEYKRVVAPYYYKDSIIRSIHNFKDGDMPFIANRLSDDIVKTIKNNYSEIQFDMVTFVPMRNLHQKKRGFNQAELLSNEIGRKMNLPSKSILIKTRYTGIQHHKSFDERKADLFGSFDVDDSYKDKLEGKIILLIDDVKTTGSTLNECAKMLKIYGAKAVYCAAGAITLKE